MYSERLDPATPLSRENCARYPYMTTPSKRERIFKPNYVKNSDLHIYDLLLGGGEAESLHGGEKVLPTQVCSIYGTNHYSKSVDSGSNSLWKNSLIDNYCLTRLAKA